MSTATFDLASRLDDSRANNSGVKDTLDPLQRLGLFQRGADFLFGYDFFISYCWADGRHYAQELQRKLKNQGFNCFLDSSDYAKGDNWRATGQRALKKTSRLILVGTPKAVLSEPVANELRIFSGLGQRVFAIDFGGALSSIGAKEGIFKYLDPEMLRVKEEETKPALDAGPSEEVLRQIRDSFNLLRQTQRRVRWLTFLATVLAVLAVVAAISLVIAKYQTAQAVAAKNDARQQQARAVSQLAQQETKKGDGTTGMLAVLGVMPATSHIAVASTALLDAWLSNREAATMIGHTAVTSASFSSDPNGNCAVTTSDDQTTRVWDAANGAQIAVLNDHPPGDSKDALSRDVGCVFSSRDRRVVTGPDKTTRVWDLSVSPPASIALGVFEVPTASVSPDGRRAVPTSDDKTARVWDLSVTLPQPIELRGHTERVNSA